MPFRGAGPASPVEPSMAQVGIVATANSTAAAAIATSLNRGAHRLVYSTNLTLDTTGELSPSFVQYDVTSGRDT